MRKTWSAYPYIFWIIIFTVVPLALVLYFSFTVKTPAGIQFTLDNFRRFSEPIYLKVLMRSITLPPSVPCSACCWATLPSYILAKNKLKNKTPKSCCWSCPCG